MRHPELKRKSGRITPGKALAPFKQEAWLKLTPGARLRHCMQMRRLIPNLKEVHDRKLFPNLKGL
jgi:hypothetical protein